MDICISENITTINEWIAQTNSQYKISSHSLTICSAHEEPTIYNRPGLYSDHITNTIICTAVDSEHQIPIGLLSPHYLFSISLVWPPTFVYQFLFAQYMSNHQQSLVYFVRKRRLAVDVIASCHFDFSSALMQH